MLKNIILLIICIIIIIYIFKNNKKKENYANPYSVSSNNLINIQNNDYDYTPGEECFEENNLFNKPVNISISFKNNDMNNYKNSEKRRLFCTMTTESTDEEYNYLLNNSLPYNNPEIYTGESQEGNDWEIIPITCGFLIRNIKLNRYLSYGNLLKGLGDIQDNNIVTEEKLNQNIVYTGPHKYINKNYLWNIKRIKCNTYSIQHIDTGLYLNSTAPNMTPDFVDLDSESLDINKFGEINCILQPLMYWLIIPKEPVNLTECEDPYVTCEESLNDKYSSVGGNGKCCFQKLDTHVCLQGSRKEKGSQVLNYPSAPWCGIQDVCGVTYEDKCSGSGYKSSQYSGDQNLCKYSDPPALSADGYKLCDCSSLPTKEDCDNVGSSGDCKWTEHVPI